MKKTIVLLCVMFVVVSVNACSNNERLDDVTSSSIQYTQTEQTEVSDISYSNNAGDASSSETVTASDTTTEQESQSAAVSNTSVPNTISETYSKSETSSVPEENVANHSSASQSSHLQPTSSQAETQTETPTEIPSVPSTSETPKASHDLVIEANGKRFSATLYENETVNAFRQLLPLTLNMSELNGNEKYYYLNSTLPTDSSCPEEIHSGDLMLYGDSCLVLFYKNFSTSYSYTSLGKIDDPSGLADAVGSGDVQITFEIQ